MRTCKKKKQGEKTNKNSPLYKKETTEMKTAAVKHYFTTVRLSKMATKIACARVQQSPR